MALDGLWSDAYTRQIYAYLLADIGNENGVAGLLGNIYAESGICPYRQQGMNFDNSWSLTLQFRTMTREEFVRYDGNTGYSLAQWTSYGRRYNYYDYIGGSSYIGDSQKSMEFLLHELKNDYPGIYSVLTNATSIRTASDKVLHDYESPAVQTEEVEILRAFYGEQIYELYHDTPPTPPPTPVTRSKLPIWLLHKITNERR